MVAASASRGDTLGRMCCSKRVMERRTGTEATASRAKRRRSTSVVVVVVARCLVLWLLRQDGGGVHAVQTL